MAIEPSISAESNSANSPVRVFSGAALEAGMVKALLESAGIPAFLENEHMGTLAPWRVEAGGLNPVGVTVAGRDAQSALETIQSYQNSGPANEA